MSYKTDYQKWCAKVTDETLLEELMSIKGNDEEIQKRFGQPLVFGTAGLRGVLGAGTGMMNVYTVRWTTKGLADYINETSGGGSVAIAYDSRNMSTEFAKETASVLAANGIDVYIYNQLMPTPMLSFAVRDLKCNAGVMITASHNPAKYNGYKVYGPDGCQMTTEDADAVYTRIGKVDMFADTQGMDFDEGVECGRIKYIQKNTIERYFAAVKARQINPKACLRYPLKVVYSPLNGTGNLPVRRILSEIGVNSVIVVPEQELPDGNFTTCPYPNPETREALSLGLALCEKEKPDIFIATDPDADRIGVAVRNSDKYEILTGNEVGVLLLNYICTALTENKKMPKDPVTVRSIVSSSLADRIAETFGVEMRTVLTGFKYIGEQVLFLEQAGQEERFIFGFEESCGYLSGGYVRDKDAVFASMLLCEMTSYYRSKNKNLILVLEDLYKKYGWFRHKVYNASFENNGGTRKMASVMSKLRKKGPEKICGYKVVEVRDYLERTDTDLLTGSVSAIDLPPADVLEYFLGNGAKVMVRPSGTEPKMKVYLTACEDSSERSEQLIGALMEAAPGLIGL